MSVESSLEQDMLDSYFCERCGDRPCSCSDPGRVEPKFVPHPGVERFLPDSDFQCHQPEEVDEPDVWVPTEAEKDVAKPIRIAHMTVGGKAPKRSRSPPAPRRVARLDEFFDQYGTPMDQRVTMCRAYASFVASTLPKKQKK